MTPAAFALLLTAAGLDVAANVLLKHSDGFRRPLPGVLALGLIVVAFTLMGLSLRSVPLATAYATWGAAGVILTAVLSRVPRRHRAAAQRVGGPTADRREHGRAAQRCLSSAA